MHILLSANLQPQIMLLPVRQRQQGLGKWGYPMPDILRPWSGAAELLAGAVADIRELRKGVTVGGLRIKDLIDEGRK
jgi:hypothetical protein